MPFIEARIIYVDTNRNVLDAISFGQDWFRDVPYLNKGLRESGDVSHPEIGDIIMCQLGPDGVPEIKKFYSARRYDSNDLPSQLTNKAASISKELPGDRYFSGPDGAFLKLLRGGQASVGSSPLAQTIYLAIEGLVRTVAQNYEMISSGSRLYSINNNGEIITRFCFNTSEKFFTEGAQKNEGAEAENFEYQIDFTSGGGFSIITGEIQSDGKRKNNLTIRMMKTGDMEIYCGDFMYINLNSSGSYDINIVDKDGNVVYNKSAAVTNGLALLNEVIKGDVIRYIDGNMYEEVTGFKNQKSLMSIESAMVIQNNSTMTRNSSAINNTDLAPGNIS